MSCITGASPVWASGSISGAFPSLTTEAYFDSLPLQLINGAGMSCADAKAYIQANVMPFLTIVKDGTNVPGYAGSTVDWGGASGSAGLFYDSTSAPTTTYTTVGGVENPWPSLTAAVDFFGSWSLQFTGAGTAIVPVANLLQTFDFEAWWCCASGCCGAPIGGPKSGFLIPRPPTPEVGEENVNTPILKTPLYLSNHTFQFPANFWRK